MPSSTGATVTSMTMNHLVQLGRRFKNHSSHCFSVCDFSTYRLIYRQLTQVCVIDPDRFIQVQLTFTSIECLGIVVLEVQIRMEHNCKHHTTVTNSDQIRTPFS